MRPQLKGTLLVRSDDRHIDVVGLFARARAYVANSDRVVSGNYLVALTHQRSFKRNIVLALPFLAST
jgi:hypothetical protein